MNYLSQFDLLQIRTRLQAAAHQTFDVMNPNALQSALAAPRQAVFGQEVHREFADKAAILFSRLIKNHPFVDGNKRIAVAALRLFAQRNQTELSASDHELLNYARRIVLEDDASQELEAWLAERLAPGAGIRGDLKKK